MAVRKGRDGQMVLVVCNFAPVVHHDSIDMSVAWRAARWGKGGDDYINCPLDRAQYERFVDELLGRTKPKESSAKGHPRLWAKLRTVATLSGPDRRAVVRFIDSLLARQQLEAQRGH